VRLIAELQASWLDMLCRRQTAAAQRAGAASPLANARCSVISRVSPTDIKGGSRAGRSAGSAAAQPRKAGPVDDAAAAAARDFLLGSDVAAQAIVGAQADGGGAAAGAGAQLPQVPELNTVASQQQQLQFPQPPRHADPARRWNRSRTCLDACHNAPSSPPALAQQTWEEGPATL